MLFKNVSQLLFIIVSIRSILITWCCK